MLALALLGAGVAARTGRSEDDPGRPRIVFDETERVFPTAYVGSRVVHSFRFTNGGKRDLVVQRVDPGCGCLFAKVGRATVPPGESGTIELALDTTEKQGTPVTVRASVFSNDPRGATHLTLKGDVLSCYRPVPAGAFAGLFVRSKGPKTLEVKVPGALDAKNGYRLLDVAPSASWMTVTTRPLTAAELAGLDSKGGHAFTITVLPAIPAGTFLGHVAVKTDCATQPAFRIVVVGTASDAVRGSESVSFGRFRRGEEVERTATLDRVDGGSGIRILAIEFDRERLQVTPEVVQEGLRTDLRVRARSGIAPGPFACPIVVHLDDPAGPIVRIVAFGDVTPRVTADPAKALLRVGAAPARIALRADGGAVESAAVAPAEAPFEASLERATDGSATLVVTAKAAARPGAKAEVVLRTNVPLEERVSVPVELLDR